MTTGIYRTCAKCGATILVADEPCPACLLESGLNPDAAASDTENLRDFGDYELIEEIGRGGQGVVYRARQKNLKRMVALKLIALGAWATEAHLKRFRREAEAAASLDHSGIVPIYEFGERDGCYYFSMKLVEGEKLDELSVRAPISIQLAAQWIAKVARMVQHAHERGILHRDIKPGNILLDGNGEPHLTDFGLARVIETQPDMTSEFSGTPNYMSPEQAENKTPSPATDVYGLGAVLYQLLTGQPPSVGKTHYETVRAVLETEPRRPQFLNPKVDVDLETICLKCLEKDPQRRYPSALLLAEDLERWLRHEPIRARRAGILSRSRKFVRRNQVVAVLAALLIVSALAGGALFWKQQQSAIEPKSTRDVQAYQLYLQAQALSRPSNPSDPVTIEKLARAAELANQAVARDPHFAIGYALLAKINLSLYWIQGRTDPAPRARAEAALRTAESLAPEAGETHLARAVFHYFGNHDYDRALEELDVAARLLPTNAEVFRTSAVIERRLGRWREALRHFSKASELDARNGSYLIEVVQTYLILRQYAEADQMADRGVFAFPQAADQFWSLKGESALAQGDIARARMAAERISAPGAFPLLRIRILLYERNFAEAERFSLAQWQGKDESFARFFAPESAWAARAQGDFEKMRSVLRVARQANSAALREPPEPGVLSDMGKIDAGLGRKEEALRACREAVELRPISRDAVEGPEYATSLAIAYAWTGERDLAFEQLSALAKVPGGPTYGELKFHPIWDDLRGDSRFAGILAEAAKPIALP